jgi:hypothetical protein
LTFVLLVVVLHLGLASMAASRHLLLPAAQLPLFACDPDR